LAIVGALLLVHTIGVTRRKSWVWLHRHGHPHISDGITDARTGVVQAHAIA